MNTKINQHCSLYISEVTAMVKVGGQTDRPKQYAPDNSTPMHTKDTSHLLVSTLLENRSNYFVISAISLN